MNLEGRLQRLRRTAAPPCPDELEWISQLAERFGVELPAYAAGVFAEVSELCYGGLSFGEVGERAPLRSYEGAQAHVDAPAIPEPAVTGEGLRLVSYKPLFSGPAVERVEELQFQRPRAEVELSRTDAEHRGIRAGDSVTVTAGSLSVTLRARIGNDLRPGVARVPKEHSGGLHGAVDIAPAEVPA